MSKKLTLIALLALLMVLSGCSLFRSAAVDNDDQTTFGKGTVVRPLAEAAGSWIIKVQTTKDGQETTLDVPPDMLREAGEFGYLSQMSWTGVMKCENPVIEVTKINGKKSKRD